MACIHKIARTLDYWGTIHNTQSPVASNAMTGWGHCFRDFCRTGDGSRGDTPGGMKPDAAKNRIDLI